jgi:hypothetical protein
MKSEGVGKDKKKKAPGREKKNKKLSDSGSCH